MNPRELRLLESDSPLVADVITGIDLANREPRTLLAGCASDIHAWHVYLGTDGAIHRVIYDGRGIRFDHTPEERIARNADYVPPRPVHPEACDYEFCLKLRQHGVTIAFTAWSGAAAGTGPYHGLVNAELVSP